MIIPWQELAESTLDNLLQEYVSRDGTDYGEQEVALATRVGQVREALRRQQLMIWFDENAQSAGLIPKEQALFLDGESGQVVEAESGQDGSVQDEPVQDGSAQDGVL